MIFHIDIMIFRFVFVVISRVEREMLFRRFSTIDGEMVVEIVAGGSWSIGDRRKNTRWNSRTWWWLDDGKLGLNCLFWSMMKSNQFLRRGYKGVDRSEGDRGVGLRRGCGRNIKLSDDRRWQLEVVFGCSVWVPVKSCGSMLNSGRYDGTGWSELSARS